MALLGYTLIFCLFLCILRIAVLASICITQAFMMWKFINFQLRRWREHSTFQAPAVKKKPPVTKGRSSRKGTGLYSANSEKPEVENTFFFFSCFGVLFIIFLRFKILKRANSTYQQNQKENYLPHLKVWWFPRISYSPQKPSCKDLSRKFCRLGDFEPLQTNVYMGSFNE